MMLLEGPYSNIPYDLIAVGDTETTGLAPFGHVDGVLTQDPSGPDRVCSAAFTVYNRAGKSWMPIRAISFLCNPGRPIPAAASAVNGFHWSGYGDPTPGDKFDLAGLPSFTAFAQPLLDFLSDVPLGFHNSAFDVAVIDAELDRAGYRPLQAPVFCTKKAFSDLRGMGRPHTYTKGTSLDALCDELRVSRLARVGNDGMPRHGAELDSSLAASCMIELEHLGWMLEENINELPHRVLLKRNSRAA